MKKEQIPVLTTSKDFNISYSKKFFSNAVWLVVSIEDYISVPNLQFPYADAMKFTEAIKKAYGISSHQIIQLRNPSKESLLNGINEITRTHSGKDIIFYYSGHSVFSSAGLTMITLNKDKSQEESLSLTEIKDKFNNQNSISFFWDACTWEYGQ